MGACGEDRRLHARHLLDVLGGDPPALVGARLQRAQPRARRIDEHAVERRFAGARLGGASQLDPHIASAHPPRRAGQLARTAAVPVDGHELTAGAHERGQMRRLASRRSAQVEHAIPGSRRHAARCHHRSAGLGDEGAVAPQRRTVHVERALHDHGLGDLGVEVHVQGLPSARSAPTRSSRRLAGRPARLAHEPVGERGGVHHERVRSQGKL